jgi:hypothetical protein
MATLSVFSDVICLTFCGTAFSEGDVLVQPVGLLFMETTSSFSEFQAPQELHLPAHLALSAPHSPQKKTVLLFAMLQITSKGMFSCYQLLHVFYLERL